MTLISFSFTNSKFAPQIQYSKYNRQGMLNLVEFQVSPPRAMATWISLAIREQFEILGTKSSYRIMPLIMSYFWET
jgi:hypothetical protein